LGCLADLLDRVAGFDYHEATDRIFSLMADDEDNPVPPDRTEDVRSEAHKHPSIEVDINKLFDVIRLLDHDCKDVDHIVPSPPERRLAERANADQTIIEEIEEILRPHYAEIRDQDRLLPAMNACQSDTQRKALAEGLRGQAYTWAIKALRGALGHPEIGPMEPGRFDDLVNQLVIRLAEDAAESFSIPGNTDFPDCHHQILSALLEDLPKIAERAQEVNQRRYLGDRRSELAEKQKRGRRASPSNNKLAKKVRNMKGLSHLAICKQLDQDEVARPSRAAWRHLKFEKAYHDPNFGASVRKWISAKKRDAG
jgi:hypothetical protein